MKILTAPGARRRHAWNLLATMAGLLFFGGYLIRSTTCGVDSLFTHNHSLLYTAPVESKFLSSQVVVRIALMELDFSASQLVHNSAEVTL